jgi:hypothetical protein
VFDICATIGVFCCDIAAWIARFCFLMFFSGLECSDLPGGWFFVFQACGDESIFEPST